MPVPMSLVGDRPIGRHDSNFGLNTKMVDQIHLEMKFTYSFANFFHPFVGELIQRLNTEPLADLMDPIWQNSLKTPDPATNSPNDFFNQCYAPNNNNLLIKVEHFRKEIDVLMDRSYAPYNWELFFYSVLAVAVNLSKSQRFAEAQRWFHFIFDPTSHDAITSPQSCWKFLGFRQDDPSNPKTIDDVITVLSLPADQLTPEQLQMQQRVLVGYRMIMSSPFQPHAVARTRPVAYQYHVVMKYLDNLIAWGDHLFQQDTIESINEATRIYVLAANILGERPEEVPQLGNVKAKTFAQLQGQISTDLGNAFVEMESLFPFNVAMPAGSIPANGQNNSAALFGIGRTLYFCVPTNPKLLGYWDTVAGRLFKIRHSENLAGVFRQLVLFDPPIDPGLLVKAAAAGIDIGSIVNGLNQPVGPLRGLPVIQKALELCSEVRALGSALLSALEKGDAEHLALVRQRHETQIQQMTQEVRFLQWKSAQEATKSLTTTRATALERLHYYQRLLGVPADPNAPDSLPRDQQELTADNFDDVFAGLVEKYDRSITLQKLPNLAISGDSSPTQQSGATGAGKLYLNTNEGLELNVLLPGSRDLKLGASVTDTISAILTFIPEFMANSEFWGLGASSTVFGGSKLADAGKINSEIMKTAAGLMQDDAGIASRTAGYQRRADDWMLQYNLVAHELMQIGRQILTSLISEQIAHHEYLNIQQQIANTQEVEQFLHDKFTNEELYIWMQGEISRLYYKYYRFAYDTARKAERTMKQELMRPEVDAQDFVQFNYWDGGRKGLLSGEALYLDVKRMEMAYHDNNKPELELTKPVSLRQLNPMALLTLKATGTCQVTVPEWLYDLGCPGHYMRRIKNIALSIPSVAGPYTSVNCTLSLLKSNLRKSSDGEYARLSSEDDRFVDYIGAVQSIVTSTGQNDSGMFETNLRAERFLPFEGAGGESTWKLDLPKDYPAFDYATISDVILHIRYTARQGVEPAKVKTALDNLFKQANQAGLALLFSLRHDFPSEWSAFVKGTGDLTATIRRDYFPYFTQGKQITITGFDLYSQDVTKHRIVGDQTAWNAATADLEDKNKQAFTVSIAPDPQVLARNPDAQVCLIIRYSLS
jgi:hypothetical protein